MTNPSTMTALQLWGLLPSWMRGHQLATIPEPETTEPDEYDGEHVEEDDIAEAHIILSHEKGKAGSFHRPVLDIDFPVHVVPSSTPGHFHLYLDKPMPWSKYRNLLSALESAGIIEKGYARVSEARGYTSVRLPHVRKAADHDG